MGTGNSKRYSGTKGSVANLDLTPNVQIKVSTEYLLDNSKFINGVSTTHIHNTRTAHTIYKISLLPNNDFSLTELEIISKISGLDVMNSEKLITNGGILVSGKASKIAKTIRLLKNTKLLFEIYPEFPY